MNGQPRLAAQKVRQHGNAALTVVVSEGACQRNPSMSKNHSVVHNKTRVKIIRLYQPNFSQRSLKTKVQGTCSECAREAGSSCSLAGTAGVLGDDIAGTCVSSSPCSSRLPVTLLYFGRQLT